MFETGDEDNAFKLVYTYWETLKTSEMFKMWPKWGLIAGFWEPSFVDATPAHERIHGKLINKMKRKVAFQSVDMNTGLLHSYNETMPTLYQ